MRRVIQLLVLALFLPGTTGCAAFIGAGLRELFDDGDKPRYEKKDYWGHFLDELFEDDCD